MGYRFRCLRGRSHRTLAEETPSTVSRKLIDAHEHERRWLARELHDDISQRLYLLRLNLEHLIERDRPLVELRDGIGDAMQQVSELAADVQGLSHRLHSAKLEHLGLAEAAAGYCGEVGHQHKVHVELRAENIPRELPSGISLSIFRVLQEALQNAIKHSGSPHFDVLLTHDSNEIHLTVRDAGRGFDAAHAINGRGLGLTSMK